MDNFKVYFKDSDFISIINYIKNAGTDHSGKILILYGINNSIKSTFINKIKEIIKALPLPLPYKMYFYNEINWKVYFQIKHILSNKHSSIILSLEQQIEEEYIKKNSICVNMIYNYDKIIQKLSPFKNIDNLIIYIDNIINFKNHNNRILILCGPSNTKIIQIIKEIFKDIPICTCISYRLHKSYFPLYFFEEKYNENHTEYDIQLSSINCILAGLPYLHRSDKTLMYVECKKENKPSIIGCLSTLEYLKKYPSLERRSIIINC